MNINGGVIIIGSLLWEQTPIRHKWRKLYLTDIDKKIPVPLKIRYGRESKQNRKGTYTMIFSNHPSTGLGQGYILGFKDSIKNFRQLEKQAFALASAEGIWKETGEPSINAGWGTVGLFVNPNIDQKDKHSADLIRTRWKQLYTKYTDFDPAQFTIDPNENRVIDSNGFLQIAWTDGMNDFDFLIATPVKPIPRRTLTSEEIGQRIIDKDYREYFDQNRLNDIITFQDIEILHYING